MRKKCFSKKSPACITFANVPLAKASHIAESRVNMRGYYGSTQVHMGPVLQPSAPGGVRQACPLRLLRHLCGDDLKICKYPVPRQT